MRQNIVERTKIVYFLIISYEFLKMAQNYPNMAYFRLFQLELEKQDRIA